MHLVAYVIYHQIVVSMENLSILAHTIMRIGAFVYVMMIMTRRRKPLGVLNKTFCCICHHLLL